MTSLADRMAANLAGRLGALHTRVDDAAADDDAAGALAAAHHIEVIERLAEASCGSATTTAYPESCIQLPLRRTAARALLSLDPAFLGVIESKDSDGRSAVALAAASADGSCLAQFLGRSKDSIVDSAPDTARVAKAGYKCARGERVASWGRLCGQLRGRPVIVAADTTITELQALSCGTLPGWPIEPELLFSLDVFVEVGAMRGDGVAIIDLAPRGPRTGIAQTGLVREALAQAQAVAGSMRACANYEL